jgi:beta-lactamase class A
MGSSASTAIAVVSIVWTLALSACGPSIPTKPLGAAAPDAVAQQTAPPAPLPSANRPGLFQERSIDELDPRFGALLQQREGDVGVAVVVPERGTTYVWKPGARFPLDSGVKVLILAVVLDQADKAQRELSDAERLLLEDMITWSDNDAATELWEQSGGYRGINRFLRSAGLREIMPDRGLYWGDTSGSAEVMAQLLGRIAWGDLLSDSSRAYAVDLLTRVDEEQRWGIPSGVPQAAHDPLVGVKNGWWPAEDGWEVNSSGFVLARLAGPSYSIAVLTAKQPTFEYAVETIEALSGLAHAALWSPTLAGRAPVVAP